MKIMDEKGRIFGKINVIDFMAIIFLFSLIPVFYFGHKIYTKKPVPVVVETKPAIEAPVILEHQKNIIDVELNFNLRNLEPDTAKLIAVGDKEIDKSGQTIGEILSLEKFEPQTYELRIEGFLKKVIPDPVKKEVLASLRLKVEVKGDNFYYKDKIISHRSAIDFITDKYQVEGFFVPPDSLEKVDILSVQDQLNTILRRIDIMDTESDSLRGRLHRIEIFLKDSELSKIPKDQKKR